MKQSDAATRAAVLTAAGRGAIAVVRVAGERANEVLARIFRSARNAHGSRIETNRLRLGRIGAGTGDEVVMVRESSGSVEIHCHGGRTAVGLILDALIAAGVEIVDPRECMAIDHPRQTRREANESLAHATTARAAEILLEQAAGALDQELERISRLLRNPGLATALGLRQSLEDLIARGRVGVKLETGWKVVLAGRPNVGKSRLLNSMAGYERAIVHEIPGTTRDVVVARIACDGWPVDLCDTAGLRETADQIEALGVRRARESQRDADLVLLLLDGSAPLTRTDHALLSTYGNALVVATKCDRPWIWRGQVEPRVRVSALTGEGIEALVAAISERLVPSPPAMGAGVPFRAHQVATLRGAIDCLAANDPRAAAALIDQLCA
jgi:tRNA modification GTPase